MKDLSGGGGGGGERESLLGTLSCITGNRRSRAPRKIQQEMIKRPFLSHFFARSVTSLKTRLVSQPAYIDSKTLPVT